VEKGTMEGRGGLNPLSCNAPQCTFFFFTCLMPDDFTRQWEALQLNGLITQILHVDYCMSSIPLLSS
jgi:hypothetical protein